MPRALSLVIPEGLIVIAAVVLARFGASLAGRRRDRGQPGELQPEIWKLIEW